MMKYIIHKTRPTERGSWAVMEMKHREIVTCRQDNIKGNVRSIIGTVKNVLSGISRGKGLSDYTIDGDACPAHEQIQGEYFLCLYTMFQN
jgi:hypothetical protein